MKATNEKPNDNYRLADNTFLKQSRKKKQKQLYFSINSILHLLQVARQYFFIILCLQL